MSEFKVGDRVRILPGVATPFVGMDGTISEKSGRMSGALRQWIGTSSYSKEGKNGRSSAWNSCASRSQSSS